MKASTLARALTLSLAALANLTLLAAHAQTPSGQWTLRYDANGNLTGVIDPHGQQTQQQWDRLGRLQRITQPAPSTGGPRPIIELGHDARGHPAWVRDPKQLSTQYQRDGLGNLIQLSSPDTGITTYSRDAAGNLTQATDARGVSASYSHDALNRLTAITFSDATPAITLSWDEDGAGNLGRLTGMHDAHSHTAWRHDSLGRLVHKHQQVASVGHTVAYTWTEADRLASIRYPSGRTVYHQYDAAGQLQRLVLDATRVLYEVQEREPFGPPRVFASGDGHQGMRLHDADGRPWTVGSANRFAVLGWDAADRLAWRAEDDDPAQDHQYGYDHLDRLTSWTHASRQEGYAYDLTGNRLSHQDGQTSRAYTYPSSSHRLQQITQPEHSYTWDAAGNVQTDGDGRQYEHDALGRLSRITHGAYTSQYVYNARWQRLRKSSNVPGVGTRHYVWDERGLLLGEYDAQGQPIVEIVWGEQGEPVALLQGAPTSTQVLWVESDHLYTPRRVYDSQHRLRWRWDNADPWGRQLPDEQPTANLPPIELNLRFPGQHYDAESGLHYNWHRYYDPRIGRYIQSDPIGLAGGISTFGYVEGDPLSYSDPEGLQRGGRSSGNPRVHHPGID